MPELERELRDVGRALAFPEAPDLAEPVRLAIGAWPRRRPARRRRALAVALAALALAGLAALAVPQARTAVLEWLGLRGASVERTETQPVAPAVPDELGLGDPVTLAEARERAPFPTPDPGAAGLGPPDEVRYDPATAGGQVAFLWRRPDGGTRALLTAFHAPLGAGEHVAKLAGPETEVLRLEIAGAPALWLEGAPHSFVYLGPDGKPRAETLRLAANTLLWERGELTLRLEGDLTREEALRVARALAE